MNALVNFNNQPLAMSSREIASLLASRHGDVCRSIERLMLSGAISGYTPLPYTHEQNQQTYFEYFISKRDSYVIVAQLSPEFTAALVDRWQELEKQQSGLFPIPSTLSEALRLAADQADKIEQQKQLIAIQAPKADFADRIAGADKGVLIGNFAKTVGIGPKKLFKMLRDMRVLMASGQRRNLPFQEYIDRGYFEVNERPYELNDETRLSFTPLITGKGQQWLTNRLIAAGYLRAVAADAEVML